MLSNEISGNSLFFFLLALPWYNQTKKKRQKGDRQKKAAKVVLAALLPFPGLEEEACFRAHFASQAIGGFSCSLSCWKNERCVIFPIGAIRHFL